MRGHHHCCLPQNLLVPCHRTQQPLPTTTPLHPSTSAIHPLLSFSSPFIATLVFRADLTTHSPIRASIRHNQQNPHTPTQRLHACSLPPHRNFYPAPPYFRSHYPTTWLPAHTHTLRPLPCPLHISQRLTLLPALRHHFRSSPHTHHNMLDSPRQSPSHYL